MHFLAGNQWSNLVTDPLDRAFSEFGRNIRGNGSCTSSSQCPSGYACVNGNCIRTSTTPTGGGTSGGQINNAGGCRQNDPNSPCNSAGRSACSTTPNCGNIPSPRPEECCGSRCCSFGSATSSRPGVNCYCGKCPEDKGKSCNIFCDGYSSANGEDVMGCTPEVSCTACTSCSLFSGTCEPVSGAPCWCEGSECQQDCLSCDINPASPSFGLCIPARSGACSACTHVESYECPCGETVGPITACRIYGPGGSGYGGNVIISSKSATELAQEQCASASSCDECKGDCTSKTYSGDVPPCPGQTKCTDNGSIAGTGGQNFSFRTECDMSKVPDSCSDAECNCHSDCAACELCSQAGTCQEDSECSQSECDETTSFIVRWKVRYDTYTADCDPTQTICTGFGGNSYSTTISDVVAGTEPTVTTESDGTIGNCSGEQNTTVVVSYTKCVAGVPEAYRQPLGSPGCSVNVSSGAIADPYDVEITEA